MELDAPREPQSPQNNRKMYIMSVCTAEPNPRPKRVQTAGGGALPVIMSIIRSSAKPTTTATITSECAVQSHQKKEMAITVGISRPPVTVVFASCCHTSQNR